MRGSRLRKIRIKSEEAEEEKKEKEDVEWICESSHNIE